MYWGLRKSLFRTVYGSLKTCHKQEVQKLGLLHHNWVINPERGTFGGDNFCVMPEGKWGSVITGTSFNLFFSYN